MRNRTIQREIRNYIKSGIPKERIRVVCEEKLDRTCGYCNDDGPIIDETPWRAVKPGWRIVVKG